MLSFDLFETMDNSFFSTQHENEETVDPQCDSMFTKTEHELNTPTPTRTPMPSPHGSFCNSPLDFMLLDHQALEDQVDTVVEDPVTAAAAKTAQQEFQIKVQTLLSKKENEVKSFIREFAASTEKPNDPTPSTKDLLDEADEQAYIAQCENQLAEASLLVSHKYGNVFKEYLNRQQ